MLNLRRVIRAIAKGRLLVLAILALTARNMKRSDHALTKFEVLHIRPHLLDSAHKLEAVPLIN